MSWTSHIVWGAFTSLFPIIAVGIKYLDEPGLNESLFPFQYIIHLPFLNAIVNLFLQVIIAPVIRQSSYSQYTNWIIGLIAGLIYATYTRYVGGLNLPQNLWSMKNPNNIYLSMVFYWTIIYGLILPFIQRQVCFHGPKGY